MYEFNYVSCILIMYLMNKRVINSQQHIAVRSTTGACQALHSGAGSYYLGIDYGTSGARCTVIDENESIVSEYKTTYGDGGASSAKAWELALVELVESIPSETRLGLKAIAIDGTSSSALLVDMDGNPITDAKMYNEAQDPRFVQIISTIAPPEHTVLSPTSTLAKAYAFVDTLHDADTCTLLHQADYIGFLFHRKLGHTDWNNALKVGFDPALEKYPEWLAANSHVFRILPRHVHAPGDPVGTIDRKMADTFGISESCIVCAGTTDSIAAFLASGAQYPGQSVTSLGSTIAIKLISEKEVNSSTHGVYSHRLGSSWLVGGASNSGGAVLRQFFTDEELVSLTADIDVGKPSGLDYIALPSEGERFPDNDPTLMPRLTPRPREDAVFLQGMLEAMARTEARAYRLLEELGATPVKEVLTCGGGAKNPAWSELRERLIGVPVSACQQGEASFGAALLAKRGIEQSL